jgi:hypothetical protein
MIALFALLLVHSGLASAHPDDATSILGGWRVEQVQNGENTLTFPAAFRSGGQDVVWGRWLWVFDEGMITLATQVAIRNKDVQGTKGKWTTREGAYQWCHAQITVPAKQDHGTIYLPDRIDTEARVGRYGKEPIAVGSCNIQLTGMSKLTIGAAPEGSPTDAIGLKNEKGDLSFVLVPDGRSYDLQSVIPEAKKAEAAAK